LVTGAGTGGFEFETGSGVYTELQCGSYIFMDADYGRNFNRDGEPTATYERASDEHGRLAVSAATNRLGLGDKIRLIPGHCDPTVNLYDWYVCVRANRVEQLWPITARGAVY
jgi:D-serine deaminase-like pyridoxal phosphate-dependent protein